MLEKYFHKASYSDDSRLSSLFMANKGALKIFKDNYNVIIMDYTYSTNCFSIPLLNIVRVTGNNTTIHLVNVFLSYEKEADFV